VVFSSSWSSSAKNAIDTEKPAGERFLVAGGRAGRVGSTSNTIGRVSVAPPADGIGPGVHAGGPGTFVLWDNRGTGQKPPLRKWITRARSFRGPSDRTGRARSPAATRPG